MSIFMQARGLTDDNVFFGDSGVFESKFDDLNTLFKSLQRSYGKCIGKLYHKNGDCIGWKFKKKLPYKVTYIVITHVTLHKKMPEVTTKYFYKKVMRRKKGES
ncbi:MAG: hypothetical protein KAU20_05660 [Nanoarchaeota archaeon]|nr:hypothetical protein [Nanoarchaeota archaeon]